MAEQAVNSIYALLQRPEILCDNIIKNLTRRAFSPKKSANKSQPRPKSQDPDAMAEDNQAEEANRTATQGGDDGEDKDVAEKLANRAPASKDTKELRTYRGKGAKHILRRNESNGENSQSRFEIAFLGCLSNMTR
ncbi:hypothetical protein QCA50_017801 [Cerrena zonata]|uniref:Uncharacterized protein n=1 Tax=Cerrena zonata TaxID=2478898 RepID=A0AAW0FCH3_9APHY